MKQRGVEVNSFRLCLKNSTNSELLILQWNIVPESYRGQTNATFNGKTAGKYAEVNNMYTVVWMDAQQQ